MFRENSPRRRNSPSSTARDDSHGGKREASFRGVQHDGRHELRRQLFLFVVAAGFVFSVVFGVGFGFVVGFAVGGGIGYVGSE